MDATAGSTAPPGPSARELAGRAFEIDRIRRLLEDARRGRSGTLAVVGEAGAGKSALLAAAADLASGMLVVTCRGAEGEADLPFSGIHDLFARHPATTAPFPVLRRLLEGGAPSGRDRFAAYVETLRALAALADEAPVLALVDDSQWLDSASDEAIRFVARRLGHEGVALLLAGRVGAAVYARAAIPVMPLAGLGAADARRLIAAASGVRPDADVTARLVDATGGNPLALRLAALRLPAPVLQGAAPLGDPPPVAEGGTELFATAISGLPRRTRLALAATAAAGARATPGVLDSVLARLGLGRADLEPAERHDVVRIETGVAFVHPLARAAAYHLAAAPDRRRAHGALAELVDAPDARAWHLAAAAIGPDDAAADELAAVAESHAGAGAPRAAAHALARSAELCTSGALRAERLLRAAQEAVLAGQHAMAETAAARGLGEAAASPRQRAALQATLASVRASEGRLAEAREVLVRAAAEVEVFDRRTAADLLVDAALPGLWSGQVASALVPARQAYALASAAGGVSGGGERGTALLLVLLGRAPEAQTALARWTAHAQASDPLSEPQHALALCRLLIWTERWADARALLQEFEAGARARAPGALPILLELRAELDWREGDWRSGLSAAAEGIELAEQTGQPLPLMRCLVVRARYEACMGRGADCTADLAWFAELSRDLGDEPWIAGMAEVPAGLRALASGDAASAATLLRAATAAADRREVREPGAVLYLGDLAEAEHMRGDRVAAERAVIALEARAAQVARAGAAAVARRCRGLLMDDESALDELAAAEGELGRLGWRFDSARASLALGERLRRSRRRVEARLALRRALDAFDELGAEPWSVRARSELRATGAKVARRGGMPTTELTPQELRVALAVAEGATNREAAAALFLSTKTVEHHLGGVYRKLGVRSRTELARRFHSEGGQGFSPMRPVSGEP